VNQNKVPQLFVSTGATRRDDPKYYPGRVTATAAVPITVERYLWRPP